MWLAQLCPPGGSEGIHHPHLRRAHAPWRQANPSLRPPALGKHRTASGIFELFDSPSHFYQGLGQFSSGQFSSGQLDEAVAGITPTYTHTHTERTVQGWWWWR